MSIEIEGPQGYEYQYLVSLYLALRFIRFCNTPEIYIETAGEDGDQAEDAKIKYQIQSKPNVLYIQVKKHTGQEVSFEDFCNWLCHFGRRQADSFLLMQLKVDDNRVCFVTDGRCQDSLVPYLRNDVFEDTVNAICLSDNDSRIKLADVTNIRNCLPANYHANGALANLRKEKVKSFFRNICVRDLKNILERICIADQQSKQKVQELIRKLLNTQFSIKRSDVDFVIKLLIDCIIEGRDKGINIVSSIIGILKQYTQRILPLDIKQPIKILQQKVLEKQLEENHVLLLTGLPFCGKTIAAQGIAQQYAALGYTVFLENDLDEGTKVLNVHTDDLKLLLLEDPFGSIHIISQKAEFVRKLTRLVATKVTATSKLIVTTRRDILLEAFNKQTIEECQVHGNQWFDLTMSDLSFAQKVWYTVYGAGDESRKCFQKLADYIGKHEKGVFLEIGEIYNLEVNHKDVLSLTKKTAEEILTVARISSLDVVKKVEEISVIATHVFLALGFSCNTIRNTTFRELAFILSNSKERPALLEKLSSGKRGITVSFGFSETKETAHCPEYSKDFSFTVDITNILIEFEKYGYITIDRELEKVRFLHPVFSFAAKLLFRQELEQTLDSVALLNMGRRALSALDKNVNLAALEFLRTFMLFDNDKRQKLLSLVLEALDSMYPAVRDKAVIILEAFFYELPKEQQEYVLQSIKDPANERYTFYWHNGEPVINANISFLDNLVFLREEVVDTEAINTVSTITNVSPAQMYSTLQSEVKDHLPLNTLHIALEYDENFIRAEAIYLLFKNFAGQINVDDYLLDGEDCNVVCQMFKGALDSWSKFNNIDREHIISYFNTQLKRISVAKRIKSYLEHFGYEHSTDGIDWERVSVSEIVPLWETWAVVFTAFLDNIQTDFMNINEHRMIYCLDKMLQHVQKQKLLINLLDAWYCWLGRVCVADDYGMSIADYLVKYADPASEERFNFFCKLLGNTDTNYLTAYINHFVNSWSLLTETERDKVKAVLSSQRNDVKWLQAIVLTRDIVPACLQQVVLGVTLPDSASVWIETLKHNDLLEYCLNIYCGHPQPLWYNGYHHKAKERWKKIIVELLKYETELQDQVFQIAMREFVFTEYSKMRDYEEYSEDVWKCLLSDKARRRIVFDYLLIATVTKNQNHVALWQNYFAHCTTVEIKESCKEIAKYIEAVEFYQDEEETVNMFGAKILLNYLYPLLKSDFEVFKMQVDIGNAIKELEQQKDTDYRAKDFIESFRLNFKEKIMGMYSGKPPRMKSTRSRVIDMMDRLHLECKEITDVLNERRKKTLELANKQQKDKKFTDWYKLDNWNGK